MAFLEKVLRFFKKYWRASMVVLDVISFFIAIGLSTVIKFDAPVFYPDWFVDNMNYIMCVDLAATLIMFFVFRTYKRMWQYPVTKDYGELFFVFVASKVITAACFFYIWRTFTRSFFTWFFIYSVMFGVMVFAVRGIVLFGFSFWRQKFSKKTNLTAIKKKKVIIIGAGSAASRLITEFRSEKFLERYNVVALIDDNNRKRGNILNGVKVYGNRNKIIEAAEKYSADEIYFAVPSASETTKKEILDICKQTGCVLKTLPSLVSISFETSLGAQFRKVEYTDLLGREQIKPDLTKTFELLKGKTVLVSGGGGSIGSELVRQIAKSGAAKTIIVFDICENGAYDIQQEIKRTYPNVDLRSIIGSVRDEQRLQEVFEEYHPDFVYHAAAHKHVPLMEDSPNEAVKNNVFGTLNLARTADKYGAKRFVMISTDKAVNPTNVMGATKRICEMIVQSFNKTSKTEFVAVRFGNVLGSNGSVIPLFKEQIAAGGPVTVTHPDIIRYFMLIPEAVSLVLQAGANAKGGEVFILDMGSPVKIRELAENLIRLSGYIPGEDIEIKYTGLREGEKLYEELLISEEGIEKTGNDLIYVAKPIDINVENLFTQLSDLDENIERFTRPEIIEKISEIVPTYAPNNSEFNKQKEKETVEV